MAKSRSSLKSLGYANEAFSHTNTLTDRGKERGKTQLNPFVQTHTLHGTEKTKGKGKYKAKG